MPTNNYIQLKASNQTSYMKFMAIEMKLPHQRMDSIEYTVGGGVDKAAGPILRKWQYTLRVPVDTTVYRGVTNFGRFTELQTLYDYNDAHGVPTDVVDFADHWGNTSSVYFSGDLDPSSLTTIIEGSNAWFLVPITLVEKVSDA